MHDTYGTDVGGGYIAAPHAANCACDTCLRKAAMLGAPGPQRRVNPAQSIEGWGNIAGHAGPLPAHEKPQAGMSSSGDGDHWMPAPDEIMRE